MNRRTKVLIVAALVLCVLFVPFIPISYYLPYEEEVPVISQVLLTNEIVNNTNLVVEGMDYLYWSKTLEAGRTIKFNVRSDEPLQIAMLSSSDFNEFEDTNQLDPSEEYIQETTDANLTYHHLTSETQYFIIHNNQLSSEAEPVNVNIRSVSIIEEWTEEHVEYTFERVIREQTALVPLWQVIMGTTPDF